MNEKQERSTSAFSLITNRLYWALNYGRPVGQQAVFLGYKYIFDQAQYKNEMGKIALDLVAHVIPDLTEVVALLFSSKEGISSDDFYESVKDKIDGVLKKPIEKYGFSLNDRGIGDILTPHFMKNDVIPILFVVRDLPKYCKYMKENNLLGDIKNIKTDLLHRLEKNGDHEVRKYFVVAKDNLYDIAENDPVLVSQIKKIFNVLTYADKVVTFINSMNLSPESSFEFGSYINKKGTKKTEFLAKVIWHLVMKETLVGSHLDYKLDLDDSGTTAGNVLCLSQEEQNEAYLKPSELEFIKQLEDALECAREAQKSFLDVVIPLGFVGSEEIKNLWSIVNCLPKSMTDGAKGLFTEDSNAWSKNSASYTGNALGVFVNQLEKSDYSFVTQYAGPLPAQIEQLTQIIASYGPDPKVKAAQLTDSEKEAFKNSAIRLFFELSSFEDAWLAQKGGALLFPIWTHEEILRRGIVEQALKGMDVSDDTVALLLSIIKKRIFARLICEAESRELYLGLASGVLTKPLIIQLDNFYKVCLLFADFVMKKDKVDAKKENNFDLRALNNTTVLTVRLQNIVQQKQVCQEKVDFAKKAKEDLGTFVSDFFSLELGRDSARLRRLYQSFQKYVIEYDPRLSVLIDMAIKPLNQNVGNDIPRKSELGRDNLEHMKLEVQKLCDKEIATFEHYLKMADSRLVEVPQQITNKLYTLSRQKTYTCFIINEWAWLGDQNPFDVTNPGSFNGYIPIDAFESITPEQKPILYNLHSTRMLTLSHIDTQIAAFLTQLIDYKTAKNPKKIINDLEVRYRVLQPYLVDSMCSNLESDADERMVKCLFDLAKNPELTYEELAKHSETKNRVDAVITLMTDSLAELKRKLPEEIKHSAGRREIFKATVNEIPEDQVLTLESDLVVRQNKWIRHQNLSGAAKQVKIKLKELLGIFDSSLGLSTINLNSEHMPPCPEMEHDLVSLTEPAQVSMIKQILNVIHYIDSNFKYLESLDRDISKTNINHYYLKGPIIEGLFQIAPLLELTKAVQTGFALMQQPQAQVIQDTLGGVYSDLMEAWNKIHPLYLRDYNEVKTTNPNKLDYPGLWYTTLAVKVLPEHLNHVAINEAYRAAHAQKTQVKAKELTQYIEELLTNINNSEYGHLLRKSPYILFKFIPELLTELGRFCKEVNVFTKSHIKGIQATLYRLLEETDELEFKLSLEVGLLSKPAKVNLDKFFNSFIEPLGLSLEDSATLVTSAQSFEKRLQKNRTEQKEIAACLVSEEKELVSLDSFLELLDDINYKIETDQSILREEKTQFQKAYWANYRELQLQQVNYPLSVDQRDKSEELDTFCNECFEAELAKFKKKGEVSFFPALKDVMYLTKHVHAAKQGHINTLKTSSRYLKKQKYALNDMKREFVQNEARVALKKLVNNMIEHKVDSFYKALNPPMILSAELEGTFKQQISSVKQELLAPVGNKYTPELEIAIKSRLRGVFTAFEDERYKPSLHLGAILKQITRFQEYCQNQTPYENAVTLEKKRTLLKELGTIALDKQLTFQERIKKIKTIAESPSFQTTLLQQADRQSVYTVLAGLFFDLFHSIFNYFGWTCHPGDIYTSLNDTIKKALVPLEPESHVKESPHELPVNRTLKRNAMFLSRKAILKQLFHEFLKHEELALEPGISPGTLLASSSTFDALLAINSAVQRLSKELGEVATGSDQQYLDDFHHLIAKLKEYKTPSHDVVPVAGQVMPKTHSCAWLIFAPMVINGDSSSLSYETKDDFIKQVSKTGLSRTFNKDVSIKETGLALAVEYKNPEMVDVFLCSEIYDYRLNKDDLNVLLSLTDDPTTRMALFRNSPQLMDWIKTDPDLQVSCVKSFEELELLWNHLLVADRKTFIEQTNVALWLNLLDEGIDKQKIKQLLGDEFPALNKKVNELKEYFKLSPSSSPDELSKKRGLVNKALQYLTHKEQFAYLEGINTLYPSPLQKGELDNLLASLGYYRKGRKLTILRYVPPKEVEPVHNKLINELIDLKLEAHELIEALNKIEEYMNAPETREDHGDFLKTLGRNAVENEYKTQSFVVRWFNKLMRWLGITSESPLHPHINKLNKICKAAMDNLCPVEMRPVSGELIMDILPPQEDYNSYKTALSEYAEYNIASFWQSIPEKARELIVTEPLRFDALLRFMSKHIQELFIGTEEKIIRVEAIVKLEEEMKLTDSEIKQGLDKKTLEYFNTPQGLTQLLLETPSFKAESHLPYLQTAMNSVGIEWLQNNNHILELLLHSDDKVFNQISKYLPRLSDSCDEVTFKNDLLSLLPSTINEKQFNRFLKVYCTSAENFSSLLGDVYTNDQQKAEKYWNLVTQDTWDNWYKGVTHAQEWSAVLGNLRLDERLVFFDKLVSGGKLEAEEFCSFLKGKKEAVRKDLWTNIPNEQWNTWLEKRLPPQTQSFLESVPLSIRIDFFEEMLKKRTKQDKFCFFVTRTHTVDTIYPDDVNQIMAPYYDEQKKNQNVDVLDGNRQEATIVLTVQAQLKQLMVKKRKKFDEDFVGLMKQTTTLKQLITSKDEPIARASTWWDFFVQATPEVQFVQSIQKTLGVMEKLYNEIQKHPLLQFLKDDGQLLLNQTKAQKDAFNNQLEQLKLAMAEVRNLSEQLQNQNDDDYSRSEPIEKACRDMESMFQKIEGLHPKIANDNKPAENEMLVVFNPLLK